MDKTLALAALHAAARGARAVLGNFPKNELRDTAAALVAAQADELAALARLAAPAGVDHPDAAIDGRDLLRDAARARLRQLYRGGEVPAKLLRDCATPCDCELHLLLAPDRRILEFGRTLEKVATIGSVVEAGSLSEALSKIFGGRPSRGGDGAEADEPGESGAAD